MSIAASSAGVAAQNVTGATLRAQAHRHRRLLAFELPPLSARRICGRFQARCSSRPQSLAAPTATCGRRSRIRSSDWFASRRREPRRFTKPAIARARTCRRSRSPASPRLPTETSGTSMTPTSASFHRARGAVTDFPLTEPGVCPGPSGMRIVAAPRLRRRLGNAPSARRTARSFTCDERKHDVLHASRVRFTERPGRRADGNLYVAGQVGANSDAGIAQAVVAGRRVVSSSVHDVASVSNLGLVGIAQSADGDIWATTGSCTPSAFIRLHSASTFAAASPTCSRRSAARIPYYLTALPTARCGRRTTPMRAPRGLRRAFIRRRRPSSTCSCPTPGGAAGSEFDVAWGRTEISISRTIRARQRPPAT